ncbi:hypothetical protein FQA47_007054 [Oryzias melastigma]|uniref:Uncharacterized protein n=1 Tax=Oryzias melastigma TaxID=30732 RepID=A0A834C3P6_ORYME|nr:hypothetical protein FQA47_007054 [Oryzias melastigma]
MGCTPSKSTGIYTNERECRDLDTCSTLVSSSQRSAVSTPERPRERAENSSGKQMFLNVPSRDVQGLSVIQSSSFEGSTISSTPITSEGERIS